MNQGHNLGLVGRKVGMTSTDGVVIWNGAISSLRRFKEDVREVQAGFECGIGLTDFQDLKPGDIKKMK